MKVRQEDLFGPWALLNVATEAYLLPCKTLWRAPLVYAWVVLGGHVREWLSESEGLAAMAGCRDTRRGRAN